MFLFTALKSDNARMSRIYWYVFLPLGTAYFDGDALPALPILLFLAPPSPSPLLPPAKSLLLWFHVHLACVGETTDNDGRVGERSKPPKSMSASALFFQSINSDICCFKHSALALASDNVRVFFCLRRSLSV